MRPTSSRLQAAACLAAVLLIGWLAGCGAPREATVGAATPPVYVATIPPVAMLLEPIVAGRAEVVTILPAGASPHTYSPRPTDAAAAERALAVVMVGEALDGWAARLAGNRTPLRLTDLLPVSERLLFDEGDHDHDHAEDGHVHEAGAVDPHFWTDPVATETIIGPLVAALSELDPDGAPVYAANAEALRRELERLDAELHARLDPVRGRAAVLFHPSFRYLFRRYGLVEAAIIEPLPGKTPTPREVGDMAARAREAGARAVLTEPQLPPRPALVLAETTGLPLREIDPLGGGDGRRTLAELLLGNADVLAEALR